MTTLLQTMVVWLAAGWCACVVQHLTIGRRFGSEENRKEHAALLLSILLWPFSLVFAAMVVFRGDK